MIFTGIKRKSNQLFFKKRLPGFLKNNHRSSSKKVKKIIVFLDDISKKSAIESGIISLLKLSKEDVEMLVFKPKASKENKIDDIFTSKDFGWYGKIKSESLKSILTNKYDLLINYSKVESLYSNLLILQCKAAFRVGFAHFDNRFYDLLIECKNTDIELFNSELKKYLKILNKI
jgi:hypothetical protein